MRPARKRIAETEFTRAKLRVANAILELAAEVQIAFYHVQGMRQLAEVLNISADTAQVSYQLAQRFNEAGNLSELALAQQRRAAAEMSAELMRARAGLQATRDKLNGLLGLIETERHWVLGRTLPELPALDPVQNLVEGSAIKRRLDLAESRQEIAQLTEALELTRDYRWIGGASIGVSTKRDPGGSRVSGPNFSVEIPIFDQRQAEIARLESLLEQSKSRCVALELAIRNEVRAASNHVNAARKIVEYYRDELVPAHEQVIKFTQQKQNFMLIDVFELLFARQQQTQAYMGYIESLTEYWVARAHLARVIGIGIPDIINPAMASSKSHDSDMMASDSDEEHKANSNPEETTQH